MNKWKEAFKNVLWLFVFFVVVPFVVMGQGTTFFTCQPVPLGAPDCDGKKTCDKEVCGNGTCSSTCGETQQNCPLDCCESETCGNGVCNSDCGENKNNCLNDCYTQLCPQMPGGICGDGTCLDRCENKSNCRVDCMSKGCSERTTVSSYTCNGLSCTATTVFKDCTYEDGYVDTTSTTTVSPQGCEACLAKMKN